MIEKSLQQLTEKNMYHFTVPMPVEKEHFEKLLSINSQVEKSKITGVYFSLPINCSDATGFEQLRTGYRIPTKFDYWREYIEYSIEKGFDFVYLLNSPKGFMSESLILDKQLERLHKLLENLRKTGCNKVRVSNAQLLSYILKNYPDFKIYTSTSFEHTQMKQYDTFLRMFPEISGMVPSYVVNRNFTLLKNLKQLYKGIEIELMVNEGCLPGCPIRVQHNLTIPFALTNVLKSRSSNLSVSFFSSKCQLYSSKHLLEEVCRSNLIYPWEIEEYSKIGINNFKLVGRNSYEFYVGSYLDIYLMYLKGVDDYKNIENEEYKILNHYVSCSDLLNVKIKDIKPYLPNIKHFINQGHLCSSVCGFQCRYCYECAEKIEKILSSQNKKD